MALTYKTKYTCTSISQQFILGNKKLNVTQVFTLSNLVTWVITNISLYNGVAPITQVTHVHNKNSNIQGRSLNVIYK